MGNQKNNIKEEKENTTINIGADANKNIGNKASQVVKQDTKKTNTQPAGSSLVDTSKDTPINPVKKTVGGIKPDLAPKTTTTSTTEPVIKEENTGENMYVEYAKDMSKETPFNLGDKKYQYVWAKYPNGSLDIGVYAYAGDITYSYEYFNNVILKSVPKNEEKNKLSGGYVREKKVEEDANDAFKSSPDSDNPEVGKELGVGYGTGTGNVNRMWNKMKTNPDLIKYIKDLKSPVDKERATLEFIEMMNLPSQMNGKLKHALDKLALQDKPNLSKPPDINKLDDDIKPRMSKKDLVEYINQYKISKVVVENITIKNLKEKYNG